MVKVPTEPEAKASYVGAMFGRIAGRYDRMNRLMTAGRDGSWRRLAVRMAEPVPGGVALDVGCGTGDLALELAGYPLRMVVGVDLAAPMVRLARGKVAAAGLEDLVHLGMGDALRLPFPSDTFDCVVTGFTLRNVALEIFPWRRGPLAPLLRLYFRAAMPLLGALVARDRGAYTYLPTSVRGFVTPDELAGLMADAGLDEVGYRPMALGTVAVHWGVVRGAALRHAQENAP